jgi:DNA-binding response OmpR family regulator
MPRLDGFEVCTRLRATPGCETLPVLMVTGLEDTASIDRAYSVGATDFTSKPLNWAALPYRLRYMLRASETLGHLVSSRTDLKRAHQIAGLGSWKWSAENRALRMIREAQRLIGYPPDEFAASIDSLLEHVHVADRSLVHSWFAELGEHLSVANS